jgi:replicative DNA helicase
MYREADSPGPAADVAARCEQLLFEAADPAAMATGGPKGSAEWVRVALSQIDERAERGGALDGLSTGLAGLDGFLAGLKPGQMIVVGARPGVGKTALGLRIGLANSAAGVPVLFISAEMPTGEIAARALAQRSGVGLRAIQSGRFGEGEAGRVAEAGRELEAEPFFIDDTSGVSAARVASELRRAVRRRRVGLCVVDFLQLLVPDNPRENRVLQVGGMARSIKLAARACGVPIVTLCQLNRESEGRDGGRPRLADLRDSGEIEQNADAVILLHVPPGQSADEPVWRVDAIVAKNRNGPVGETTLDYARPIVRFDNARK